MTDRQAYTVAHFWTLLAVLWFAMAVNWATDSEYLHAIVTATVGTGCWVAGERMRWRRDT